MNRRTMTILALAALAAASCGENPQAPPVDEPPVPGTLLVVLDTPHADDVALLLTLSGPDTMTALQVVPAGVQSESAWVGGNIKVALFGALADGAVLAFHVPDARAVDQYTATLVEAAGPAAALRPAAPAYGLEVVRPVAGASLQAR